jgi:hypothetical protein
MLFGGASSPNSGPAAATAAKAAAKNFVPIIVLSPFSITDFTDYSVKVYHIPAGFSIILLARHKIRG